MADLAKYSLEPISSRHAEALLEGDKAGQDLHLLTTHRTYAWSSEYVDDLIRRFNSERSSGQSQRYAIIAEDRRCVGTVELTKIDLIHGHANLGITVWSPMDRGKGAGRFACEHVINIAFSTLRLEVLTATVFESNVASRRLFERLGFKVAGLVPGRYFVDGSRVGEVTFYIHRGMLSWG